MDTAPNSLPNAQEERDRLIGYAFRSLGQRALTEAELRAKLSRRSENAELIEEIIKRVQELGYQNDAGVALAENNRGNVGTHRIRQTLKRRGIEQNLIEDTLSTRDPDQELEAAVELLARRWPNLARKKNPKSSAFAFLARRGFPSGAIWAAINRVSEEVGLETSEQAFPASHF